MAKKTAPRKGAAGKMAAVRVSIRRQAAELKIAAEAPRQTDALESAIQEALEASQTFPPVTAGADERPESGRRVTGASDLIE